MCIKDQQLSFKSFVLSFFHLLSPRCIVLRISTTSARRQMASTSSPDKITPSDDEIVAEIRRLRQHDPEAGSGPLHTMLGQEHPDWVFGVKRLKQIMRDAQLTLHQLPPTPLALSNNPNSTANLQPSSSFIGAGPTATSPSQTFPAGPSTTD